jgi:hypothetical protein
MSRMMMCFLILALTTSLPGFAGNPCADMAVPETIENLTLRNTWSYPLGLTGGDGLTVAERLAANGIELHCGEFYEYLDGQGQPGAMVQVGHYTMTNPDQPGMLQTMLDRGGYLMINVGNQSLYLKEIDPAESRRFQAAVMALEDLDATEEQRDEIMTMLLERFGKYRMEATWEQGGAIYSILADDEATIRSIAMTILCRPVV